MQGYFHIVILAIVPLVSSYCHYDVLDKCKFRIQCNKQIKGFQVPPECQGSSNSKHPVSIELILAHAAEPFVYQNHDVDLLSAITIFRVSDVIPKTNLSMLEFMPRLQKLYAGGNDIKEINGSPFNFHNRLNTIDLSHNSLGCITELFQFETFPNRIEKLSLAYNVIKQLPGDVFSELSSLRELDLSYNLISDLSEDPFDDLIVLHTLKLNNNKIKELNHAFIKLLNLKHLFLKGNQIENVDIKSLIMIRDLETFDISNNKLETVKPVIFSRHWSHFSSNSVCKINLSNNQLTFIPNTTTEMFLKRLQYKFDVTSELDLSGNIISDIQYNAFQSLQQIETLDLSRNKIIDFVVNPNHLSHVKYLNLSFNFIAQLNIDSFYLMSNLHNLDLSHNYFHNLPDEIFRTDSLRYVNMSDNEITDWKDVRIKIFHRHGGVLDLTNNSIASLRIPFREGINLHTLVLSLNEIVDASSVNLIDHQDLQNLDMSWNLIEELDENSLLLPTSLTSLDLNHNLITYIAPATFHRVSNLRKLFLAHNNISDIDYGSFQGLSCLLDLDLSFNRIQYLDSKVMMELKSLRILSLKFNGLQALEYKSWLTHKNELKVYLEGNSFSCDWLGTALSDYNNGYSKMRPSVMLPSVVSSYSLEGIPCQKSEVLNLQSAVLADDRLLHIVQRILEAVLDQNKIITSYVYKRQDFLQDTIYPVSMRPAKK